MVAAARTDAADVDLARPTATRDGREPLVSVRDLDVMFRRGGRDLHALRGVSFDIMPGEIVGLVGESGSGKSVLGLSLLGLLPRDPAPSVSGSARRRRRRHGVGVRRGAPPAAQATIWARCSRTR